MAQTATIAPTDVEVRFKDRQTGLRLFFHPDFLTSLEVQLTESGGVDSIQAYVSSRFDTAFAPAEGALMEVVVLSDPAAPGRPEPWPRWRGILSTPEATLDQTEQRSLLGYGFMEDMKHVVLDNDLVEGGGGDLASMASQAVQAYVMARPWLQSNYELAISNTGVLRETLKVDKSDCRAAMDAICDQSPCLAVWGWRVSAITGANQFVFAPRIGTVGNAFYVGNNVEYFSLPKELSQVNNAIRLTGGPSYFPNLLGVVTGENASFEHCEARGALGKNLVNDPDFNDRSWWSLYGGSSYKSGGLLEGPTYVRGSMVEMDNPGEGLRESLTGLSAQFPVVGNYLTLSIRARNEHGTDTRGATASFWWLDSSGTKISGGTADATMALLLGTAGFWQETRFTTSARPTGADGFEIQIEAGSGTGAVLAGFVSLYDASNLYPTGWELDLYGLGHSGAPYFAIVDPRYPDAWPGNTASPRGDGGTRCLRIAGHFNDANGMDGALKPTGSALSPCIGNQTLNFVGRFKRTPGNTNPTGKLFLEVHAYKSDQSTSVTDGKYTINAGAVGDTWTEFTYTITLDNQAAFVVGYPTFRGDTDILIDCLQLRDVAGGTEWIPGANWWRRIFAEDVCTIGTAQYNSATTYDRREGYVTNPALLEWDTVQGWAWAAAYMNVVAIPPQRARLKLTSETIQRLDPLDGTLVRIAGLATAVADDYASGVTYTFSGPNLAVSADLGGKPATLARIIAGGSNYQNQSTISVGGGGASVAGGGSYGGGGGGGGTGSPGGSLTVETVDGTVSLSGITTLILPNGTASQPGGVVGTAEYTPIGGGAGWTFRGVWAIGTTYVINDTVRSATNGFYLSLTAGNVGNDPEADTTGANWACMVAPDNIEPGVRT